MKKKNLASVVVIFLLLVSSYFSARWMIADFYGERVALSLETWMRSSATPSPSALNSHIDFVNASLKWNPSSPRYKELKARLLLYKAPDASGIVEVNLLLNEILDLHREAVLERPHWSYSWSNVAYIKGLKKEFDREYDSAVENAMKYGPYEAATLTRTIQSGLRSWESVHPETQKFILKAIPNLSLISSQSSRIIRRLLNENDLSEQICDELVFPSEPNRRRICG